MKAFPSNISSHKNSVIVGCGGYLPERIVTNHEMAKMVDTSDDWIVERTGIKTRHFAAPHQSTSDLAFEAALVALKQANLSPQDIDLIIVATITPDRTFPSTAIFVQHKLCNTTALAFDVSGACAGFLLALQTADNFLKLGQGKHALVIGAEVMSSLIDMEDRRTCILFGDGAGAVVLTCQESHENQEQRGILGIHLQSDGQYHPILFADGGVSTNKMVGKLRMNGQDVYRHAVTKMTDCAKKILKTYDLTIDDIDWLIPHQANLRIIESVAQKLKISSEKIILTVQDHANTSAASIPLALWSACVQGRIKPGDLILHEAIGGGLIWGSALVRF
ncbi:MAG: beta-ketoacyl-ACP synthase III [Janthinobacterium lividum]